MRVKQDLQLFVICFSAVLPLLLTGCGAVQSAANLPGQAVRVVTPGEKGGQPVDPVQVQQGVIRFADQFQSRLIIGIDRLRQGTNEVDPAEILRWKIAFTMETTAIASGANAIANLFDITAFVTSTRMAVEQHWQPDVFGDSGLPLLQSCKEAETEAWDLVGTLLKPEQQKQLRAAIEKWHKANPLPENVLAARAVGFAKMLAESSKTEDGQSGSVFGMLGLDPLAGLDPAMREMTQARMLAERALYVTQKLPLLIRWQTELLMINTINQPSLQQLVTNTTDIANSTARFATVAEKLPGQVSAEREEILKGLDAQAKNLTPLVNEAHLTLVAGTQLSDSVNTMLITLDALMKRFGVGETNAATAAAAAAAAATPPSTNSEPFSILDYAHTANQVESATRQLTELLIVLNQTVSPANLSNLSANVSPVVQQAQAGGRDVVNYAFSRAILLVVIVLLAALLYRYLSLKLAASRKASGPS
jgi:hypothetical protein